MLWLYVQPNASRDKIVGSYQDALKVQITAPPVDGSANNYLIKWLAGLFNVPKSDVIIEKGQQSRNKRIRVRQAGKLPEAISLSS